MVIPNNVELPPYEELTIPEVNLSTATLMAASPFVGKACEAVNNEFMLCRLELNDPRCCVELGKLVTGCTLTFFKNMKKNCAHEFNQYANCVEKSSGDFAFSGCRRTQKVFDACMKDNMDMDRPGFGYFCRPRIHSSLAAPPVPCPCPCEPIVPDATQFLPDCKPRPPPRFGSRLYWSNE